MPRSIWSGSISFGLVNIPVKLVPATRDKDIHFHQLHKSDMSRIQYRTVCAAEDKEVDRQDIVKGYEVSPDQYVVLSEQEIEAAAPESSRVIDIVAFVNADHLDALYFEHPYYLLPEQGATKSYRLLAEAMARENKVGIAHLVLRNHEYLAALRVVEGAICLHTMRFADEVILPQKLSGLPEEVNAGEKELAMAQQLIGALEQEFDPRQYHSEHQQRLEQLAQLSKPVGRLNPLAVQLQLAA